MEELDDWLAGSKVSCTGIILRRLCRAGIDNRLVEEFRMDGVKKVRLFDFNDGLFVHHTDYDAALAREAALREELKARALDVKAHAGRRVAAEQRNADQLALLGRALQAVRMVGRQDHLCDYALAGNVQAELEAATKPTESGASE